eukprot:PhM_4_TR15802/c0_g2_i1/m.99747
MGGNINNNSTQSCIYHNVVQLLHGLAEIHKSSFNNKNDNNGFQWTQEHVMRTQRVLDVVSNILRTSKSMSSGEPTGSAEVLCRRRRIIGGVNGVSDWQWCEDAAYNTTSCPVLLSRIMKNSTVNVSFYSCVVSNNNNDNKQRHIEEGVLIAQQRQVVVLFDDRDAASVRRQWDLVERGFLPLWESISRQRRREVPSANSYSYSRTFVKAVWFVIGG